ncbi:MAG TPA: zinc ABC transporter substrate-binding protein, partial [Solirubrobacteraceae bacterium]|nr:zinc ABC transporter substrate-binding protein [Solirubrobacteraceae bacterium]
ESAQTFPPPALPALPAPSPRLIGAPADAHSGPPADARSGAPADARSEPPADAHSGPLPGARSGLPWDARSGARPTGRRVTRRVAALVALLPILGLAACGIQRPTPGPGQIVAVGAESQYADVIAQLGRPYVKVAAILANPNSDPHGFEASPSVAATVAEAKLVVQNGLGYDSFISRVEAATPQPGRVVVDVQHLLGLPDSTANPHLWYAPATMPRVATAVAAALERLLRRHRDRFRANLARFTASLRPWWAQIAAFRARHHGVVVATTEPVADALLSALGLVNATPFAFQADVMNGTDPAPQAVSVEDGLLSHRHVRVFVYNRQVSDSLTQSFLALARAHGIPVVGVDEIQPPGLSYQAWMEGTVSALSRAVRASGSGPT